MRNRILLVDDEETIRYALRETLITEGYNVDVAENGFQALERFKVMPYDLLITDIKMPGMDGLQLVREVKKSNPCLKVISITAYGSLETVKEATRLGVAEFLSKPFKIQEIKDVIIRVLCNQDISSETNKNSIRQSQIRDNTQLSMTDNLLVPAGLSYYFTGPASQPKSTIVFDFVAISDNRAVLMFGNVSSQNEKNREWWENKHIGIMIKTIFRSKAGKTPKEMASTINNFLYKNILPHIKLSMLYALIDKKGKIIRFVNCGSSLVCSIFAHDGRVEILESYPHPLGISSKIEMFERTISYSYEDRLILSSSNTISRIMEEGELIKQAAEGLLQAIKSPQEGKFEETDLYSSFANKRDINFDDETVLFVNLNWNYTPLFSGK